MLTGLNILLRGFGNIGFDPVTNKIAMVSPMALPIPNIIAVVIPEEALGKTTLEIVCHLFAPMPREASRYEIGTDSNASSETLTIVGNALIARIKDPENQESPIGRLNKLIINGFRTAVAISIKFRLYFLDAAQ